MSDRQIDHLLIGGGIAAGNCARWLRRSGADGSIVIVGREPDPPYDRPPLSKGYLQGTERREDAYMQEAGWYADQDIELRTRTSAMKLDLGGRTVTLSDRQTVGFRQLLLATGANVRRLRVPGAELEGIDYLRTFANSDAIRANAAGKQVVLIGGSYIACEVAATLTELGSRCTLVMSEDVPLSRVFGEGPARYFETVLTDHGVGMVTGDELEAFEGADGRLTTVRTKGGRAIEADTVVVGVGVTPDVALARTAGLALGDSGGVVADAQLRTEIDGVFVAGDIAEYVSVPNGRRRLRVEHWDVAFGHGKTVALNMLGRQVDHDAVPYFFSDLADWAAIEYVGPAQRWDREIVRGSYDDGAFTVFYLQDGVVQGALTVGRSDDLQQARRLIAGATELGGDAAALGDLSSDLEQLG